MKKFLSRFALFGLLVGLAATSYAIPAAEAASDTHSQYQGAEANSIIIIVIGDDYVVVWVEGATAENALSGSLTPAVSDKIFDA
jgi:hypothetical protein